MSALVNRIVRPSGDAARPSATRSPRSARVRDVLDAKSKNRSVAVVVGALTASAGQVAQGQAASGGSDRGRDADLAAIETFHPFVAVPVCIMSLKPPARQRTALLICEILH